MRMGLIDCSPKGERVNAFLSYLCAVSDEAASAAAQLGNRAVSNSIFILAARSISKVISLVVVITLANALGDVRPAQLADAALFDFVALAKRSEAPLPDAHAWLAGASNAEANE